MRYISDWNSILRCLDDLFCAIFAKRTAQFNAVNSIFIKFFGSENSFFHI